MDHLKDKYEVLEELGKGGQATTWKARQLATGQLVALKALHLHHVENWKSVELFEREGKSLQNLAHPDIPKYIDAFSHEDNGQMSFYLVQEFVEGTNLVKEMGAQGRWDEPKALKDMTQVLQILIYLHERIPPLIHRDIKPSNFIRRPDGRLCLIDFGAVQLDAGHTSGSTVIGTPGYMPLEQMTGHAEPRSDLYSTGVTFGQLMTGMNPSQVRLVRTKLDFAAHLNFRSDVMGIIERMLEPAMEDRFQSARHALAELERATAPIQAPSSPSPAPNPAPNPAPSPPQSSPVPSQPTPKAVIDRILTTGNKPLGFKENMVRSLHRQEDWPEHAIEETNLSGMAQHMGFKRLGKRQHFAFPLQESLDVWVDPTGTVYFIESTIPGVLMNEKQGEVRGPTGELVTFFEDGTWVLRSKRGQAGLKNGNWRRRSTEDLLQDYDEHLKNVGELTSTQNKRPIKHADLDTVLALRRTKEAFSPGYTLEKGVWWSFALMNFFIGVFILWVPFFIQLTHYWLTLRRIAKARRQTPAALPTNSGLTLPQRQEAQAHQQDQQHVQQRR